MREESEGTGRPRGEFCVQDCRAELALCWGGWQCRALLQVGLGEGTGTLGVVPTLLKGRLADNLSRGAGCCRHTEPKLFLPSA